MKKLFLAILIMVWGRFAMADGSASTAAASLKIGRGARPTALGGAYLALADDAQSLTWNPAGLTALRVPQVTASHLSYFGDVSDESAAAALPLYSLGAAVAVGVSYLSTTDVYRDPWGARGETFTDFDFSVQAAYAMDFFKYLSAGLAYKVLREGYAQSFAMGSGFDLGLQSRDLFDGKLNLALAAANLGTPMGLGNRVNNLPMTFKAGMAVKPLPEWALCAEYSHQPIDYINKWYGGTEYVVGRDRRLALRAGYLYGPESDQGALAGLSAGAGLGYGPLQVDYSWVPAGDLGVSHRLSLTYSFGTF